MIFTVLFGASFSFYMLMEFVEGLEIKDSDLKNQFKVLLWFSFIFIMAGIFIITLMIPASEGEY